MTFFLVERYLPSMSSADVATATARLSESSSGAGAARHVTTILLVEEDTCLSLFEAADAGSVEAANRLARFPLDRIVTASVFGDEPR